MKRTNFSFLPIAVLVVVASAIPAVSHAQTNAEHDTDAEHDTVTVRMVANGPGRWRFEPSKITVHQGEVIRWIQADVTPHNVEFKSVPKSAQIRDIRMGPFLTQKGQTYELNIDDRFTTGKYAYICTPHVTLGMKGTITVVDSAAAHTDN